ncbi:hypothetical protein AND_007569 [Anopheles darlingi]|uniref:Uncharacterized protein n=1 Tax=Anopheles darlingi TaxID=43151 RepID=W5JBM3_ANODA|nr:hypothetical protein AND_007569 [Anopheles darlingi]
MRRPLIRNGNLRSAKLAPATAAEKPVSFAACRSSSLAQQTELQHQVDFLRSAHPSGMLTLDPAQQDCIETKLHFPVEDCKSPEQMMIDESQSVFKVFDY